MLGSKIGLLENLPIFNGLSRKQLELILSAGAKAFFEAGDNLITKDHPGDTAYLIMTGTATCLDFPGNPVTSDIIEPGSLVAELAMLADTMHPLTVQAKVRVRALALKRDALKHAMLCDPSIAQRISANLALRLKDFARDLRRLDSFLAEIEASPVPEAGRHSPLKQSPAASLPRLPQLPPLEADELFRFG